MANSRRVALAETNMVIRLNIRIIAENANQYSGYCHQLIEDEGENWLIMLTNTIQGKAMSIARTARNWRIFSGMIRRLIIQKPSKPIAKRAATDCSVILKTCILSSDVAISEKNLL